MIDIRSIDELARRLSELLPPGVGQARDELVDNFRDVLRAGLRKLDLVTREEFEVQRAVLMRAHEKVDELEVRVAQLEEAIGTPRH
jgi:BMFP domain-containing protein YqiC